ncbi:interferon alpha-inducible protein 27-like protein 2B [Montipora capricornis]|uniref:interferon alpha-inducible protein 27-like protein 2B n=1 Tax=Montipora capricornis TaxID=246305 RepID=UPI0035F1BAC3
MELSSHTWLIFLLLISPVKGEDSKKSNGLCWSNYAVVIVVGIGAVAAAPLVLSAAGFGAAGVTAGSMAAGAQSTFYGAAVESGSAFSLLQSAGAAGTGTVSNVVIALSAGTAAGTVKNMVSPCKEVVVLSAEEFFGAAEVVAGSMADRAQFAIYGGAVASGGVSALLQKAGIAGTGTIGNVVIAESADIAEEYVKNIVELSATKLFGAAGRAAGSMAAGAQSAFFGTIGNAVTAALAG